MCGLAGIYAYGDASVDLAALLRMREAMHTRGPDAAGMWSDQESGIALAHRRLAILDLTERGTQPMALPERKLQVVFNGEIYNHPELRAWCEAHGARYESDTDTETLLHLYALEGKDFVKRLRGMFAFALWDGRERSLLLARDPFGIKPLYYTVQREQVRFASQVKALLAGGVDDRIGAAGVVSFLMWGYVTEPYTWYDAIKAVPAGSSVTVYWDGRTSVHQYSDPIQPLRGDAPSLVSDGVSSLRETVRSSIQGHLLADVPIALFLSAGTDSGAMCGLLAESGDPAKIYGVTLGFNEYAGTEDDEVPLARAVAELYGCQHTVVRYQREDFQAEKERLLASMDQPTVDGVNTYFVSMAAAQAGFKVALSGIGGDELLGGYPSFRQVPHLVQRLRSVPPEVGRAARAVLAPIIRMVASPKYASTLEYGGTVGGAYLLRRALFLPWEIPGIVGSQFAARGLEALDLTGQIDKITHDITSTHDQVAALEYSIYLRNCLLRDADWAGMAHSVEIRTPLVDATLFAELAATGRRFTKSDLAQAPSRPLPSQIGTRRKTGFSVPVHVWITEGEPRARRQDGRREWALHLINLLN